MFDSFIAGAGLPVLLILLVVGFIGLIKGADLFVDGSSAVAKRFQVPPIVIGLTIVAMGTSLPETAVSSAASLSNNNEIAISNAIGSNIFNLMVVLGVCGMLSTLYVEEETIRRDIPFSAACALLLLGLGFINFLLFGSVALGRWAGVSLILVFGLYILDMLKRARRGGGATSEESSEEEVKPLFFSILLVVAGAVLIAVGGDLTVDVAAKLAGCFGMSQTLIGLTIVSIGTSLPELVTSIVAARKNELELALGNAIGSNIFNILMVLGIASAISPIGIITENVIDIVVLLVFTLVVWLFAKTRKQISVKESAVMLLLYAAYFIYIILR